MVLINGWLIYKTKETSQIWDWGFLQFFWKMLYIEHWYVDHVWWLFFSDKIGLLSFYISYIFNSFRTVNFYFPTCMVSSVIYLQSPFPSPLESVKTLLDLADHSSHISTMERQEFVQKVISWALNFAVTTQQKQTFVNLLQTHLEN